MIEEAKAVLATLSPLLGILSVFLGFALNASWNAWRNTQARREAEAEYRASVRVHMAAVEKRLASIDVSVTESAEFRGQVGSFIDDVDTRLGRIERKLDCDASSGH